MFWVAVPEVYSSPFEITETGWGEFEAGIRVFFKDPNEQVTFLILTCLPMSLRLHLLSHLLRL